MDIQNTISSIKGMLQDLSFPADKSDIAAAAEQHDVGDEIMQLIQQLPDEQFGSLKEVISKLPVQNIEGAIEGAINKIL